MNKKHLLLIGLSGLILSACTLNPTAPAPESQTEGMPEESSVAGESRTYTLNEQNGSGQSGTLTLTENDSKITAVLDLTGGDFPQPQPAHIHEGVCPSPGAAQFPLSDVVDGHSTTVLNMTMADMLATFPDLAVNVHKSGAESSIYTACGDLK